MLNKVACKAMQGGNAMNVLERNNVCRFVPHKDPFVAHASISIFSL